MAFPVTDKTRDKLAETNLEPRFAFCIDGIEDCFTAVLIKKTPRFDDGLFFDQGVVFDDLVVVEEQKALLTLDGTSKSIRQQLQPDRGSVSSVSSITIRVIDQDQVMSRIISPGVELTDILGVSGEFYVGFEGTAFPEDYVKTFRGLISEIQSGPGYVDFTINHPDERKRRRLLERVETKLNGAINSSTTSITLDSTDGLVLPADVLRSFVRIDDEIIEYTGISGSSLTGVTRGALSVYDSRAIAAAHDDNAQVTSFYMLEEGAIDLALKIMLSNGTTDPFVEGVEITHFELTDDGPVDNAIFIQGVDIQKEYGIIPGDTVSTSGAAEAANQLTDEPIEDIVLTTDGSYIVVAGPLAFENETSATLSLKSQYNVLPSECGFGMNPREVDVVEHEFIKETFLASFDYRFYIKDTIEEGKDFLEKEIYVPAALYSLPRGTKASVGLHVAPFPFSEIQTISERNVKNPSRITLRRGFTKNFYNNIVYKFDENLLDDNFEAGTVNINAQSFEELGRRKDFNIESKGLRSDLQAVSLAQTAANRLLDRYNRGAEYIENIQIFFSEGLTLEPGDTVFFDPTNLQVTNTEDGTRNKPIKFFEVANKVIDLSGTATVNITDTSFDGSLRTALFSPASLILSGSTTSVVIKPSFSRPFGQNEWRKWRELIGAQVQIRNDNFTDVGVSTIVGISGNTISLSPALSFTPGANYVMELAPYDQQTSERVKLLYTHNSDGENDFADGGEAYRYI